MYKMTERFSLPAATSSLSGRRTNSMELWLTLATMAALTSPVRSSYFYRSLYRNHMWNPFSNLCLVSRPTDIRRVLPDRFLTEEDLLKILPTVGSSEEAKGRRPPLLLSKRRVVVNSATEQMFFKSEVMTIFDSPMCHCCITEVAYEVVEQVTDFSGFNHSIINFNDAYQFIPTGRCVNENAPCGMEGRARCQQVSRAHWSLVWTPSIGVQLIAHEVPSHCQCLNIGQP